MKVLYLFLTIALFHAGCGGTKPDQGGDESASQESSSITEKPVKKESANRLLTESDLLGQYSNEPDGEPFVEITKEENQLFIQSYRNGELWHWKVPLFQVEYEQVDKWMSSDFAGFMGDCYRATSFIIADVADKEGFQEALKTKEFRKTPDFQYDPKADYILHLDYVSHNVYRMNE